MSLGRRRRDLVPPQMFAGLMQAYVTQQQQQQQTRRYLLKSEGEHITRRALSLWRWHILSAVARMF